MKKYVSLGAAMMMGQVIAKDRRHKNHNNDVAAKTQNIPKKPTH